MKWEVSPPLTAMHGSAAGVPQSGGSAAQTGEHLSQQPAREAVLSWLPKSVLAPDVGAVPFFSRKEAFTCL